MKSNIVTFLLVALGYLATPPLHAVYQVGDTVSDFELINRATGQPMSLSEFEGKIILLEWFAHWCPFCQIAAPQVDEGIVAYYEGLGGTSRGVPVVRVGLNAQSDTGSHRAKTDAFIAAYDLVPTLQDTSRSLAVQFFEDGESEQPLFAVINGVAGSPSHAQWEIVYLRNGYLSTSTPIEDFRTAIDSVRAAAPEPPTPVKLIGEEPAGPGLIRLRIEGNRRNEIILRRSDDFITWTTLQTSIPDEESGVVELDLAALAGDRFVQAVRAE